MKQHDRLFTVDFVFICLLILLTYCNITVFYNLYQFLEQIGIAKAWRGFLIGSSSLATIAFFLFASPYLTVKNSIAAATLGALILLACGVSYLYARDVPTLLLVRLANGAAVYLLSAACMTLMVSRIPTQRSGQAFSLYSVALLLPYSLVPAVCDAVVPHLESLAVGYWGMSLLLLPGLVMIFVLSRRQRAHTDEAPAPAAISLSDMYRNALSPPIALVLLLNAFYIVCFSSFFFMAKGLFQSRGFPNVGSYFTIQMFCMIAVRLFGNRLFDQVRKVRLIALSFLMASASFLLAAHSYTLPGMYLSSLIMGIGTGVSSPALYGLMFTISPPRFKTINSNLMMLSLQVGNFVGPIYGAQIMHDIGYTGLLLSNAACCLMGIGLCVLLTSRWVDVKGHIARV
ncbi:hypothetical protein JCM15519_09330 [Fundidesulfovibrio butyratiphilus]